MKAEVKRQSIALLNLTSIGLLICLAALCIPVKDHEITTNSDCGVYRSILASRQIPKESANSEDHLSIYLSISGLCFLSIAVIILLKLIYRFKVNPVKIPAI